MRYRECGEAILEQRSKKREEIMKFENAEELLDAKREQSRVHNLVHYSRKKREEIMKSENAEELLMLSVKQDLRSQTSNLSITP